MSATNNRTTRIKIEVQASGAAAELKKLVSSVGLLGKELNKVSSDLSFFKNAFISAFTFIGVREIVELSDSMQSLGARIGVLSGGAENARAVLGGLNEVAKETKTSLDGAATVYSRLAAATSDLGVSSNGVLAVTKVLQNTFRLSGATTTEATAATIQLAQGLASGQLRGQELRSTLEQNVVFGGLLAKTLKVTRGELYKFAEQGKITSGVVFKVLSENMSDVNKQAAQLGQTFSQTVTVSLNDLKLKIYDINKEFDLSGKFAQGISSITNNLATLGGVIVALAVTQIPALVLSLKGFLLGLAALNPITSLIVGALAGLAIATGYVIDNWDRLKNGAITTFSSIATFLDKVAFSAAATYATFVPFLGLITTFWQGVSSLVTQGADALSKYEEQSRRATIAELKRNDDLALSVESAAKRELDVLSKKKSAVTDEITRRSLLLEELNRLYYSGAIAVSEYYERLEKLDKKIATNNFLEGKKDLQSFNEEIAKLAKADLTRQLNQGKISIEQFNAAIKASETGKLQAQLEAGKISAKEFNQELLNLESKFNEGSPLRKGAADYLKGIGTLSEEMAGVITGAFTKLEDVFVDFTKTGRANFADFAQAVLDDLNKIIIRSLVVKPLAEALLGGFASSGSAYGGPSTTGQLSGREAFASGGIVNRTTPFFNMGKPSVMGEAGPEAILPLKRSSNGDLGVSANQAPVYVNIQNNSGAESSVSETTNADGSRTIDILIRSKVAEGIAAGSFDKVMKQSFGVNRRGS